MTARSDKKWVLPAAIPFADLKSKDLEECVYWLLDAMGAKNLEWRIGGSGKGTSDGGRDLEAQFFAPDINGEMVPRKWWVECKGRTGTLEPDTVKSAVNNALAFEGLDQIIIATNTQFSNPTRDWVKEWQKKHPRPQVELWDRNQLERYLSRHPDVVLRLFAKALSLDGQYQSVSQRFWNKIEYTPVQTLSVLWKARATLERDALGMFALIANEFAHGNIAHRPWAAILDSDELYDVLAIGLINAVYLLMRATTGGVEQTPLVRTFSYLILVSLHKKPSEAVAEAIRNSLFRGAKKDMPSEVKEYLLMPILNQLLSELQEVCSDDCRRISCSRKRLRMEDGGEIESYWLRLSPQGNEAESEQDRYLVIESKKSPCTVGFAVDDTKGCPLFEAEPTIENFEAILADVKKVIAFRSAPKVHERC